MPAVTLLLLGAMVLCYVSARRSILRPLQECVDLAAVVATGDLTRVVRTDRKDELGKLQLTLSEMTGQLARLVGDVREGVSAIATASTQIASGNDDLSSRTQEQAAALEETASSMEQMTATVKQNADNARQANQLATATRSEAEKGGAVVQKTIVAMEDINTSSRKIADIIGVVDEIAFQTNLLALNAAVEAARAGEQGAASQLWPPRYAASHNAARRRRKRSRSSSTTPSTTFGPARPWSTNRAKRWRRSSTASRRSATSSPRSRQPAASRPAASSK